MLNQSLRQLTPLRQNQSLRLAGWLAGWLAGKAIEALQAESIVKALKAFKAKSIGKACWLAGWQMRKAQAQGPGPRPRPKAKAGKFRKSDPGATELAYGRVLIYKLPSYRRTVVPAYRRTVVPSYRRTVVPSYRRTAVPSHRPTAKLRQQNP